MQGQSHLSRVTTIWTMVRDAHAEQPPAARQAMMELVERYSLPIHRYLLAVLRNEDAADEVFQEFAVRLIEGRLRRAVPERGRFRDYIKRALINLVHDHQRRRQRASGLDSSVCDAAGADDRELDAEFVNAWRQELLARAWDVLERQEKDGGQRHFSVLRLRGEHPEATSEQLAEMMSRDAKEPMSAAHVRKLLQRARERFAAELVAEIGRSIGRGSAEAIEQELIDLDLRRYCQTALASRLKESRP